MNTASAAVEAVPTIPGTPFAGGFYAGRILINGAIFALIVAPKTSGEHKDAPWLGKRKAVPGAQSFSDGYLNTLAMADAGSKLARWALDLNIGDHDDWYLPSRDELEICYRALKPTTEKNWTHRNGDNPSSVPVGYPYTATSPKQTEAEAFKAGGAEAFDDVWYWSSTDYEPGAGYAWGQGFGDGGQSNLDKGNYYRARAVRRLPI